jgi:hypothetical protein
MCVICNHVAIVASYQEYLKIPKVSNFDVIYSMVRWVGRSGSYCCFSCDWGNYYQICDSWQCLSQISWYYDMNLVVACEEVELE